MLPVLSKVFVRSFYSANAGFFLFFFFVFFGAVEGGQLVPYHLSLMRSILTSPAVLVLVLFCWTLYHLKCAGFFLRIINKREGAFLHTLQTLSSSRQWLLFALLYAAVYAPVLLYALAVGVVGWNNGYIVNTACIFLFQLLSILLFTGVVRYRLNHWLHHFRFVSFNLPVKKFLALLIFHHFSHERKNFLLLIKAFSLLLLYTILVWNRGLYDNDSFMLFYLVLLMANAALPYLAVQFLEKNFPVYRNLPISLPQRAWAFLLSYALSILPEVLYLFYFAGALPVAHRVAYSLNLLASLFLLTAMQYSEAQSREEYMKATFALLFLSIFVLHVQAFWWWIAVQFCIASILFAYGYSRFEKTEE